MKNEVCIYLITNHETSPKKYYVGRTKLPLNERFQQHIKMAKKENNGILHEAILEYGKRNFTIELLEKVDESKAHIIEQKYIKEYCSHFKDGSGYNMRYENVEYVKTYNGASIETVKNNLKNGNNWNKGIPLSEEAKQKISNTKKHRKSLGLYDGKYGHPLTEETKKKISEAAKNRKISKETRKKLSESSSNRKVYYNIEEKCRKFIKNGENIPRGYVKGKGACWYNDGKNEYCVDIWEEEKYRHGGYTKGRLV